jgi:hypothetical protein
MGAALITCGAFVLLAVTGKWQFHTQRVSRVTVKALVLSNIFKSVCLVGNGRLKEICGLEPRSNFFLFKKSAKLVRIRFENIRYSFFNLCIECHIAHLETKFCRGWSHHIKVWTDLAQMVRLERPWPWRCTVDSRITHAYWRSALRNIEKNSFCFLGYCYMALLVITISEWHMRTNYSRFGVLLLVA